MPEQVGDSADVIDNADASRFELRADGWLAELAAVSAGTGWCWPAPRFRWNWKAEASAAGW
jgi:hypothetical protein